MPKRRHGGDADDDTPTPRKSRRTATESEGLSSPPNTAERPFGRKSILRGTPTKLNGTKDFAPSPSPLKKVLFSTQSRLQDDEHDAETPTASRNDQSARRKSARLLQAQLQDESDIEEDDADVRLAAEILDGDGEREVHDFGDEMIGVADASTAPDTPSKTGSQRGRPKGRRRERTPTPPPDLPPYEMYFYQNRAGANKTSANTLPSRLLLNHEDYRTQTDLYQDPHAADVAQLKQLHRRSFDQWVFELGEGFSLCLYGYGSKRSLIMDFATQIYYEAEPPPKIIVVNGYTPGLTIRDVLTTLASQVLPNNMKLPAQPPALVDLIVARLSEQSSSLHMTVIVHSLDHPNLRKHHALVARLASHPSISLIASVDNPNYALLWDLSLTRQFRFLHHDITTFSPYEAELDVVEEVNALLGRSGRRLGGKDGVAYVLKSLPENARNLFRILVAEQLATADSEPPAIARADASFSDEEILGAEDEEEALAQTTPSKRVRGRGRPAPKSRPRAAPRVVSVSGGEGVEYRTLYHNAVEEFVCSSELNFRTLLKEFHDHQMIESRKDALGTERLVVPFGREELEGILEELA